MNTINLSEKDRRMLHSAYLDSMNAMLPNPIHAEQLREVFNGLSPAQQIAFSRLSVEQASENFFQQIGKALPGIARAIAPIAQVAAPVVGTIIGGPVGGMAGNAVGGLIGNFANRGMPQPSQPMPRPAATPEPVYPPTVAPRAAQPIVTPANPTSNQATAQLMSLLTNPQFIQSLLGQILGQRQHSNVQIQTPQGVRQTVPYGVLMNALSDLALRSAEESVRNGGLESSDYLIGLSDQYAESEISQAEKTNYLVNRLEYHLIESTRMQESRPNKHASHDALTEWFVEAKLIR